MTEIPQASIQAAARGFLPLLPGLFLAPDGGDCPTIWAEGADGVTELPEPLLTRTQANARLFDAIAALLPDRTDETED